MKKLLNPITSIFTNSREKLILGIGFFTSSIASRIGRSDYSDIGFPIALLVIFLVLIVTDSGTGGNS